ncbi:MAG: Hsp70 family protein, partial [Polyangia bacterium]
SDGQTSVEVVVTQGERPMARDNRLLGRFHLDGIPPAPRGVPQVEVTFDIDANGIVNVHARDKGTGKEQKITITASSGLSEAEIQKMVKDAEANEAVDKERKEAVEARNQLDSLVFQMEKMVGENRDKLEAAALAEVEQGITEAKKVLQENQEPKSAEPYKTAFDALQKASYKMAEQMYKQTGAAPDGGGGGAGESASSGSTTQEQKDVIDAEFEEHQ